MPGLVKSNLILATLVASGPFVEESINRSADGTLPGSEGLKLTVAMVVNVAGLNTVE